MMSNKTVNAAVLINGGEETSLDTRQTLLQERELYISKDGYLYVGASDGITPKLSTKINANRADKAINADRANMMEAAISGGQYLYKFTTSTAALGGFTVVAQKGTYSAGSLEGSTGYSGGGKFAIEPDGKIWNPTIYAGAVGVQGNEVQLRSKKVILTSAVYGKTLPSSGVEGQIFFKLS